MPCPSRAAHDHTVDGKTVAPDLKYQTATPYMSLEPGAHRYSANSPGTDMMLSACVDLRAARAYTGLVVGSRGKRVRVALERRRPRRRGRCANRSGREHRRGTGDYVVRPGDSLWAIARRGMGAGTSDAAVARYVVRIWNANERRIGTGNPDLIYPGTTLRLA